MNQIDTIERIEIKLIYDIKDRDQIYSLPFFIYKKSYIVSFYY